MSTNNKSGLATFWFLLGLIVLIFIILAQVSCGTRKINKSVTEEKSELNIKNEGTEEAKKSEVKNNDIQKTVNTKVQEDLIGYNLSPIDPKQPIEITDSQGKKTSIKNANVKVDRHSKTENTATTEIDQSKTVKDSTGKKAVKAEIKASGKKSVATSSKDIKQGILVFLLQYWWLWLIIIIVLIWVYRKKIPFIRNYFP